MSKTGAAELKSGSVWGGHSFIILGVPKDHNPTVVQPLRKGLRCLYRTNPNTPQGRGTTTPYIKGVRCLCRTNPNTPQWRGIDQVYVEYHTSVTLKTSCISFLLEVVFGGSVQDSKFSTLSIITRRNFGWSRTCITWWRSRNYTRFADCIHHPPSSHIFFCDNPNTRP